MQPPSGPRSSETPVWSAGHIIADRYRLIELVGRGSTAEVWRATDIELQGGVALKLMDPRYVGGEVAGRLLREARAASVLRSLHVVQILDYGLHDERVPFIAMELLHGETLADRIERESRLAIPDVLRIVTHVGRAVAKAHLAGIVHRDLKPENIYLCEDDEPVAKVLDFGIAKVTKQLAIGATANTGIGTLLGTPEYMSPEQATGSPVDWRTDLWSLAIIAFECLTGHRPFRGEDLMELLESIVGAPIPHPSSYAPELPSAFDAWFERAAARHPDQRFGSAREMVEALRDALAPGLTLRTP